MKILYISNEYPPETGYGGIGTYTMHCAEGMAARGHLVHVLCRSLSAEAFTIEQNGVMVHRTSPGVYPLPSHRIFYPVRMLCYKAIPHGLSRLAWARQVYAAYQGLVALKEKFDIIEYPIAEGKAIISQGNAAFPALSGFILPGKWSAVLTISTSRRLTGH